MVRAMPFVLAIAVTLTGCARLYGENTAQTLLDHPAPVGEHDRAVECGRISGEIAHQKKIGTDAPSMAEAPFTTAARRDEAARAVMALATRQDDLHCADVPESAYAAAATAPAAAPVPAPPPAPAPLKLTPAESDAVFDRCFQRCRQYTDRSKEQCFDVCTK